ncbi:methyl-accepting chemotaxis protein [Grimontia marina]|uniref:Methyl-accepting chemotaxis protein PctA n=1 Tax=Grimontia marina TaxID=646534 RepID=A0A128F0B0_9GAMM|nr:methyl-accepting chemotaxis protein [Grimontia marina]CZF80227.1 Methyl-accepting chemotaxis protein PctA [Grimontia marina]
MSAKKMTIRQRLTMFVALVCGIQFIVGAFVFYKLAYIESHIQGVAYRDIPILESLSKATEHQVEQRVHYNKAFRYALAIGKEPNAQENYNKEKAYFYKWGDKVTEDFTKVGSVLSVALTKDTAEEQVAFTEANEKFDNIKALHTKWMVHVEDVFRELDGLHYQEAVVLDVVVGEEAETTTKLVDSLLDDVGKFTETAVIDIEKRAVTLEYTVIGAVIAALIVAITIARIILAGIIRGLNKVSAALLVQAEGDFSKATVVDESGIIGELQQNLEGTRQSTNGMIAKVAQEVSDAVSLLNDAAQAVKKNSDAQSGEIMQVATAVNEMSATAQEIANNATQTQDATEEASGKSSECMRINNEAVSQTQQLIESLTQSSAALTELEKNSANITSVLDVIKGIAEQTNLLALNAAIEAARAGEQGRGFAVVADEVRSLAQRTHDSTSEIETMIVQLTSVTKDAVDTMQKSCEMGDKTIELSHQSADFLNQSSEATSRVTDMNLQVASAAEQQNGAVEDINVNVSKISEMADKSSHQVASLVNATDKLNAIAKNLRVSVGMAAS